MMIYAMRPLLALDLLFFFVLMPISIIGWRAVVLRHLLLRQLQAGRTGEMALDTGKFFQEGRAQSRPQMLITPGASITSRLAVRR